MKFPLGDYLEGERGKPRSKSVCTCAPSAARRHQRIARGEYQRHNPNTHGGLRDMCCCGLPLL